MTRSIRELAFEVGTDVVVVNYHTSSDLQKFIRSYKESDSTLYVVDVEPDNVEKSVNTAFLDGIDQCVYIPMHTNVGYSGACNAAASIGGREVVAFFNADTRLGDTTITDCYNQLMDNNDWAIVGPKQLNSRGQITSAGVFGTCKEPALRGFLQSDRPEFGTVEEAVSVSGSAYFVKRRIWNKLTYCKIYHQLHPEANGAFLPTPHFYEETWCSYHALAHGYKVVYLGNVSMIHEWHQASPVGSVEATLLPTSRAMFREMCEAHSIDHD